MFRLFRMLFLVSTQRVVFLFVVFVCLAVSIYELFDIDYSFTPIKSRNIRVIDGDTIVINNIRIRLKGIDAPELKQQCKHKHSNLIGNNMVYCSLPERDRYDRLLSYCYANNKNLSLELVRSGYAYS